MACTMAADPMVEKQLYKAAEEMVEKDVYAFIAASAGKLSDHLQEVVDAFEIEELCNLRFSVTIGDPSQPGCPLVACSTGFMEMTGFCVEDIVGHNCRFLLHGVPEEYIDQETREECRAFCEAALFNPLAKKSKWPSSYGIRKPWIDIPSGVCLSVQTNARRSGELFRNLFHMKYVELDQKVFIVALQAEIQPEDKLEKNSDLEMKVQEAFFTLEENLSTIEEVLAQHFWYSAPIRRF